MKILAVIPARGGSKGIKNKKVITVSANDSAEDSSEIKIKINNKGINWINNKNIIVRYHL